MYHGDQLTQLLEATYQLTHVRGFALEHPFGVQHTSCEGSRNCTQKVTESVRIRIISISRWQDRPSMPVQMRKNCLSRFGSYVEILLVTLFH